MTRLLALGRRQGVFWFVWLCLGFGFWELLTDTYSIPEFLVGLGSASIGASVAVIARERSQLRLRPTWAMAGRLAPLPGLAVVASIRVLIVLLRESARGRRVAGRMIALPAETGGDDPTSGARRALRELALCATPDTFAVGTDREQGVILIHELTPARGRRALRP